MKTLVVATVIATAGLFALQANNALAFDGSFGDGGYGEGGFGSETPPGLTSVQINLSIIGQGGTNVITNVDNTVTSVHFKQGRIDNNTILGLINDEFGTAFSPTNGDHLAVSNFWDGKFIVLGRDGTILLQNASSNTNGDHFALEFTHTNTVFAGTATTNFESKISVMDGSLNYESGNGSNSFHVQGFTSVNDVYWSSNNAESFELSAGLGAATFTNTNGVSGILTGSASGSGKDNAPAQ